MRKYLENILNFGKTLMQVDNYDYIEILEDCCRKLQNIMKKMSLLRENFRKEWENYRKS